jgi:hypothetical protein
MRFQNGFATAAPEKKPGSGLTFGHGPNLNDAFSGGCAISAPKSIIKAIVRFTFSSAN